MTYVEGEKTELLGTHCLTCKAPYYTYNEDTNECEQIDKEKCPSDMEE